MILLHGHTHVLTDRPTAPVTDFEDFVSRHPPDTYGRVIGNGSGAQSTLVCGEYQLDEYATNPLYPSADLPACELTGARSESVDQRDHAVGAG